MSGLGYEGHRLAPVTLISSFTQTMAQISEGGGQGGVWENSVY